MMASSIAWRPLPLPATSDIPIVLVSFETGPSRYTARLTDLAHVWTESMDREAICKRAEDEGTSIDPSDTPENMATFLAKLQAALNPPSPSETGSSVTLSSGKPGKENGRTDNLSLRITCDIPELQALQWPMHLSKQPSSAIASELVLPLIRSQYLRDQEEASLFEALQRKDAVLARMLDKLESLGTGLEHVFPILSSKKKVSRSVAEEKVAGLRPWAEDAWRSSVMENDEIPGTTAELINGVFRAQGLRQRDLTDVESTAGLEYWWHNVGTPHDMTKAAAPVTQSPPHRTVSGSQLSKNVEDDDFQVQSTPPHLKSSNGHRVIADDASTEDEDEGTESPEPPTSPVRNRGDGSEATAKSARIGIIGGKESGSSLSHDKPPEAGKKSPVPDLPQRQPGDDSETASEADDEDEASLTAQNRQQGSNERQPSNPAKSDRDDSDVDTDHIRPRHVNKSSTALKPTLGLIGRKPESPKTPPKPVKELDEKKPERQTEAPKPRIGMIGGKSNHDLAVSPNVPSRGRSPASQAHDDHDEMTETEKVRETSRERADRRRQELKRDLEKKAAAGPAKKKRRF